jgi:signal transduction histidine kinase
LLARGLVPVEVDSKGLTAALLDLTARLGELNGVSCVLECQESALVEDGRVATQLYHIAQEAIANAIKHGQARAIKVVLETRKNGTKLEIRDDGKGLPRKLRRGQGTGLQIMSYRAGLLGGKLTLRQAKPRGTVVTCLLAKGTDHEPDSET